MQRQPRIQKPGVFESLRKPSIQRADPRRGIFGLFDHIQLKLIIGGQTGVDRDAFWAHCELARESLSIQLQSKQTDLGLEDQMESNRLQAIHSVGLVKRPE